MISAERELRRLVEDWKPHVTRRLADALRHAGATKPAQTAEWVGMATTPASNKHQCVGLADSTYSDRLASAELDAFQDAYNAGLFQDSLHLLATYTPDPGTLCAIGDGHERPVTARLPRRAPARPHRVQQRLKKSQPVQSSFDLFDLVQPPKAVPLSAKRAHIVASHSSNKPYPYCLPFFFAVLTWAYRGRQITCLLGVKVQSPLLRSPAQHVRFLADILAALPNRPDNVVLDRGYDSAECRRILAETELPTVIRLKTAENRRRHCWDAATGARLDLNAELARTASLDLPPTIRVMRDEGGRKIKAHQRTRTVNVRLEQDGKPCTVVLVATYKVDFRGAIQFNRKHSFVLMTPLGSSPDKAFPLYAIRWTIEQWLNQATRSAPENRARNLNAEVIQFFAYLYRINLGILGKFRLLAAGLTRLWRQTIEGIAAARFGRWLTGCEALPDRG